MDGNLLVCRRKNTKNTLLITHSNMKIVIIKLFFNNVLEHIVKKKVQAILFLKIDKYRGKLLKSTYALNILQLMAKFPYE